VPPQFFEVLEKRHFAFGLFFGFQLRKFFVAKVGESLGRKNLYREINFHIIFPYQ